MRADKKVHAEPVFESFSTDDLGSPPDDASSAPVASEAGEESEVMMSFRTSRKTRRRIKILAATLDIPVQSLCTRILAKHLDETGSDGSPLN